MFGKVKYLLESRFQGKKNWDLIHQYTDLNVALETMEFLSEFNTEKKNQEYRVVKETRKVLRQAK